MQVPKLKQEVVSAMRVICIYEGDIILHIWVITECEGYPLLSIICMMFIIELM